MGDGKYAVLIYPHFSLQEITCLTSCLAVWYGESMDILGSEKKPYISEDGFSVTPTKTVEEAHPRDYACVILPGTMDPLPALFDDKLIAFLRKGRDSDTLFAAISSAPLLLAKAGLLESADFTAGFFMQMLDVFPFIPRERFVHRPVVESGNVITAIGMFYREFAEAVLHRLGYETGKHFLDAGWRNYTPEELTFRWSDGDFAEFRQELAQYER